MGAYSLRCMQGLRSPKPCLTCLASKEETLSSSLGNIQLRRNSDLNPFIRKKPFSIYGKKLRNEEITVEEELVLAQLKELGFNALFPCLMQLQPPYEGHSVSDYTPPDALHVVAAGILKDWIFFLVVILGYIAQRYPLRFGDNLDKLDEKLMNFQTNQSLPFRLRKFSEGTLSSKQ